jgi:hypothetical protein
MVLPQLREVLLSSWPEARLGTPRPRNVELLVRATGVSKVCCYVFPDDASEPHWVAKVPRSPADNAAFVREYALIQSLRLRGGNFLRATVPAPLWMTAVAGHIVAIEPFLRGRAMDEALLEAPGSASPAIRWCLDVALDWLLRSQVALLADPRPLCEVLVNRYLLEPIQQLRTFALLTSGERAFLDVVEDRIGQVARCPLPLVFSHGDFQPANILIDGRVVQVIDWEFGQPRGLPLMDVFGLLARVYARSRGLEEIDGYLDAYIDAFDSGFLEGGQFAELTAECVTRACRVLGVAPQWTALLFVMFLVNEANKYRTFLTRRAERGYVYLLRTRGGQAGISHAQQLARQKHVWLLGHLADQEKRLVFPTCVAPRAS